MTKPKPNPQAGFLEALGRHRKANVRKYGSEEGVPPILQGKALNPFISKELLEKSRPIKFRTPHGVAAAPSRATATSFAYSGTGNIDCGHHTIVGLANVFIADPVHCEDCSYDCEGHEEPECTPIYALHSKLKKLLSPEGSSR